MSPTGIFALLLLALMIDWISIGPDWLRDRLAFCFGLPALREGWDGSPLDRWTVGMLSTWIDQVKTTGNQKLAQASTELLLGVLVGLLAIYVIGVLLPAKASGKLGRFALLTFRKGGGGAAAGAAPGRAGLGGGGGMRLNGRLWLCAWLLGIMAELPRGLVGAVVLGAVNGLVSIVAPLPATLFGAG